MLFVKKKYLMSANKTVMDYFNIISLPIVDKMSTLVNFPDKKSNPQNVH